jgi:kinesin family protein C2/C3
VASLKDVVAKKDEEIDRLQLLKANANGAKRGMTSLRYGSQSPRRHSVGATRHSRRLSEGKGSGLMDKAASDVDNCSEYSDKHSEAGSQHSVDEFRHQKELSPQSRLFDGDVGQDFSEDIELLGFGNADSEERLSDISDGGLSMGTETDGSMSSVVEYTLFPEPAKPAENSPPESTPVQNTEK